MKNAERYGNRPNQLAGAGEGVGVQFGLKIPPVSDWGS